MNRLRSLKVFEKPLAVYPTRLTHPASHTDPCHDFVSLMAYSRDDRPDSVDAAVWTGAVLQRTCRNAWIKL